MILPLELQIAAVSKGLGRNVEMNPKTITFKQSVTVIVVRFHQTQKNGDFLLMLPI